ncbi:MAG: hypothetical protein HYU32_06085 [candidate division NC10 bacterium]|nr:hypothetical protein [candidate division NC10 bacterium]
MLEELPGDPPLAPQEVAQRAHDLLAHDDVADLAPAVVRDPGLDPEGIAVQGIGPGHEPQDLEIPRQPERGLIGQDVRHRDIEALP